MYAGSVFVQQALGWNTYISIAAILVVTAVYTVIGTLCSCYLFFLREIPFLGSLRLHYLNCRRFGGCHLYRHSSDYHHANWLHYVVGFG